MKVIGGAKAARKVKKDFLQVGEKGGPRDVMMRQSPQVGRRLSPEEITNLYANDQIIQNIIDIPAEDATREWITLNIEDQALKKKLELKLRALNAQESFQNMVRYERLRGDGFTALGMTESQDFQLSDSVETARLKSVDYLHPFSSRKVSKMNVVDDVFSIEFGEVKSFMIKNSDQREEQEVHRDRVLHLQTQKLEDADWGQSRLEPMYKYITLFDTAAWSTGQILYDYVFKKYKSNDVEGMSTQERQETQMLLDYMFRTEALAIIGTEEELEKEATNVSGINHLFEFVWETLAGSARMPKSHILGQQSGTLTGAQYDSLNYYARIAGIQENFVRPKIEYLFRLLLQSEEFGRLGPDKIDWSFSFNPLWKLDSQSDADIRKKVAETDEIYLRNQVVTSDEVREKRFTGASLSAELDFSEDELTELEKNIQEARDGYGQ
ncbi:anti-CBASS protein Acb1 family protein [Halobacillus sp. SY10]|uniref:anti-CBASS protein Acb1 family protein n=1 Tax=Halobacillus sp. SY10 TaxID=3381356 RepID=UPI003879D522